ncbi:MAG: restriction endonuclease subunit S [Chloroflexota bacterium]
MRSNLAKPGRKTWRFDQIATNVNERVEPGDVNVDHYVGLEHLDPDSLKIRRWGTPDDVGATKLRFKKGDIIFGRRRVYQRKLAVAEFDGICSAHAMVLRPKTDVVLPEFLPFFMQSDLFMNRALEISVGSLSPTINWKTLAKQEFALPPLEEQRRIAKLLLATNKVYENLSTTLDTAIALYQSVTDAHIRGDHKSDRVNTPIGVRPGDWPIVSLESTFADSLYGLSTSPRSKGKFPILRMMNIENRLTVENDLKYVNLSEKDFEKYQLKHGDILFNRTNSYELVGRTGVYKLEGKHVFASYLVRVRTDGKKLIPEFLVAYLNSSPGRQLVLSYATRGVSQTNVNATNLGKILIALPPIREQEIMISEQQAVLDNIQRLETRRESAYQLTKNSVEQLLGN